MLNSSGESENPCLVPDLRVKAFNLSPLSMILPVGLSHVAFIILRFLLYPLCWEFFIMECHLILSNSFSATIEMIMWYLSFIILMWCITFIDLHILNHHYIPGINPTWSCYTILLMYCWIQFASILLRVFASIFIRDICLQFSFLVVFSSGFGIRTMLAL